MPIPANVHQRPNGSTVKLVSVGRLHWSKGYSDLVRAMRFLPSHYSLSLVGDGPESSHIRYLVSDLNLEDRVNLAGTLPYNAIQQLLSESHAYVQSSVVEGFSNSLAEAMAKGMPVFTTPVGGTMEIIQDDHNGVVIPTRDPKMIAEILLKAEDVSLMRRVAANARLTAEREFAEDRHARNFELFYRAALCNEGK